MPLTPGICKVPIERVEDGAGDHRHDPLAVEEPLELRLVYQEGGERKEESASITMRTPGQDRELAVGFFYSEEILGGRQDLRDARPLSDRPDCNVIRVELRPGAGFDPIRLRRNFYTTSSCGVCAKTSLEALKMTGCRPLEKLTPVVSSRVVEGLPGKLGRAQPVFAQTGGLHAAALFDPWGRLISLREDVGRHNAVDKLIGRQLLDDRLPLGDRVLMVSGRTSFEILQKALRAGIPIVAAVSAPSSLAVQLARQFKMTLLGFVRGNRFNIYAGKERIRLEHPPMP
ncbi:MAG: formate dehydrogenase accessory sulfurtransferase FdhD [Acidobacteriota bacterium]